MRSGEENTRFKTGGGRVVVGRLPCPHFSRLLALYFIKNNVVLRIINSPDCILVWLVYKT